MPATIFDAPEPLARILSLMAEFPAEWALCGGWAVDVWIGRQTREHLDVDISVFAEDQGAILQHLGGRELIGHDDNVPAATKERWLGRRLDLPAHIHVEALEGVEFEFHLNERSAGDWVLNGVPQVTLPLSRCVDRSPGSVPILSPVVLLYYKAIPPGWRGERPEPRPHDDADFTALLPILDDRDRAWLHRAISTVRPGHQWLQPLEEISVARR